jgi:hypothetical protein
MMGFFCLPCPFDFKKKKKKKMLLILCGFQAPFGLGCLLVHKEVHVHKIK